MKRFLCLGLIFGVVLWGGSAWALSIAETVCYLDWNSLSITGGTYDLVGNQYTYLRADARNDIETIQGTAAEHYISWGNYSETTDVAGAAGTAETYLEYGDPDTIDRLSGWTSAQADGSETTTAGGIANVRRSGSILALSDASFEFSIDYYINHDLSTEYVGEDATAYSLLTFSLSQVHYVDGVRIVDYEVEDFANAPGNGSLTFTADLRSGMQYGFEADIYTMVSVYSPVQAAAPVPEPSTMVLMGLGLIGLAGYGRKRLKT